MARKLIELVEKNGPCHTVIWTDPPSGLRAFLVLDNMALGPAVGGIRTCRYLSEIDALHDALALARAMTIKCSLAGLEAGGGKCVVVDHERLDRTRAFAYLGKRIEELGGAFRTAGDLGTRAADLQILAAHTQYAHTDERGLSAAVARGLVQCIKACAVERGYRNIQHLRIAIQGMGLIGTAAASALASEGAELYCADLNSERAEQVVRVLGGNVLAADEILMAEVDIVAPCGAGGVLSTEVAERMRAWAVCGAANNILASPQAERILCERGILMVPDPIASAGAVIEGIGQSVMGLADRKPLIDRLFETAREVLSQSRHSGRLPSEIAREKAFRRIQSGRW